MTQFKSSRKPPSDWGDTLRFLWANPWGRGVSILLILLLLKSIPSLVNSAIDQRDMRTIISTGTVNHNPRGIHFYQWSSPLGGEGGGGNARPSPEPKALGPGGLMCCGELRLRHEKTLLVEWEWAVSQDEWERGISFPNRQAEVPIDLEEFDLNRFQQGHPPFLILFFLEDGRVGATVTYNFRNPRIPRVTAPSFEVPVKK